MARRQGLPFHIPIPGDEFEGLADEGLKADKLDDWIKGFLENAPVAKDGNWRRRNSTIVSQLEGYVDKKPLWEKAQKLFEDREFEKALKTLKRITVMMPDDHAAKMNYANALANQGQYDKAYKQLRQIKETFLGEGDYHVTVAQVQVARGDQDAAIEQCVIALEHQPDHRGAMDALETMGILAKIYEDPRDATTLTYVRTDSVLDYLKEQWSSAERDAAFYVEQLGYHETERRHEVALEAAERAIAAAGDEVNARAEIGKVGALRQLERGDDALAAAKAFVEKAADLAASHLELSKCLAKAGNSDEATAALDAALERDPGDQEALVYKLWPKDRGDIAAVQNAMGGIKEWAEKHEGNAGVWRSMARAKLVVGNDEESLALFEKAVGLAPDDDDLRSEWWGELARQLKYQEIIDDSGKRDMKVADWKLRWNEAEAYKGLKRLMEARGCYMQINTDETLHIDIRKRAKRAAMELGMGADGAGAGGAGAGGAGGDGAGGDGAGGDGAGGDAA